MPIPSRYMPPETDTNWGFCDIDIRHCFGSGAICNKEPSPKHFTMQHKGAGKKQPFRNKDCSHYKKDLNTKSEIEKL